ncbi:MAG: type II secretion system protein [Pseudomonadota bacterium]
MDILRTYRLGGESGFTLLEVILTFLIVSALAIFAAVSIWSAVYTFRLSSASAKVVHDIRFAQQQAMSHNGWYGISFSADPVNQYSVYSTDGTTDTNVTDPSSRGATLVVNLKTSYDAVISAVNIDGGTKVEFSPMGEPYTDKNGSAIALDGSLSIVAGTKTKTISISKSTGRVDTPWN